MKIKPILIVVYLILLGLLIPIGIFRFYPLATTEAVFELQKKETLSHLADKLKEQDIINNSKLLQLYVRFFSDYRKYQFGWRKLPSYYSYRDIIDTLEQPDLFKTLIAEIAIPEGFNVKKIIARAQVHGFDALKLEKLVVDKIFVQSLSVEANSLEGYLYPSTYYFYNHLPSEEDFLRLLVETFYKNLPPNFKENLEKFKLSMNEAVIFASLIEKETLLDEERSKISEVIWNRLKNKESLGIDASVIYGIENFDGNLRTSDLRNRQNYYNSRIHKGLPPTPIASPSKASLDAVFTPTNQGYYYYVLSTDKGHKNHHFSKTLDEHNQHVKELIKFQKGQKIP